MFQFSPPIFVRASLLCLSLGACASPAVNTLASESSAKTMEAQKPDTADTQTAALPASLAFVPQDVSAVFRLDLAKTMQSFLWTDLLGPQVDAFTDSVEGCDSNVVKELSDIVVASRRSDSDEESDWEARFSTTGSRTGLVQCLEALAPLFGSFTIEKTGDGFEVHSQGKQLAWVRWTDYGFRAGDGDISKSRGPVSSVYSRLMKIKLDSPLWFATAVDPALLDIPLDSGAARTHQMWFELRTDDTRVFIRGGSEYADAKTARSQPGVIDGFVEGAREKGLHLDPTEFKDSINTSIEGNWVLYHADWTHSQVFDAIEKIQSMLGQ